MVENCKKTKFLGERMVWKMFDYVRKFNMIPLSAIHRRRSIIS